MFTVMKSSSKTNGYLFVAMMASMFMYSLPQFIPYLANNTKSIDDLTSGQIMRDFESYFDQKIFLREPSINAWSLVQYTLFGEGRVGVVAGTDGWLFTNQEYMIDKSYNKRLMSGINRIQEINDSLKENGKHLIILPVPLKVDIYGNKTKIPTSNKTESLYTDFIAELNKLSISNVPINNEFHKNKNDIQLYFKSDTHWTPEGARLAAETIASQRTDLYGNKEFSTNVISNEIFEGDLYNYFSFGAFKKYTALPIETVNKYETFPLIKSPLDDALFSENTPSIALVGTSYTKNDTWNFPGFLQQSLRQDIITIANEQKGPYFSMDEFSSGELIDNKDISTVIWEFPIRTIISEDISKPNDKTVTL